MEHARQAAIEQYIEIGFLVAAALALVGLFLCRRHIARLLNGMVVLIVAIAIRLKRAIQTWGRGVHSRAEARIRRQ